MDSLAYDFSEEGNEIQIIRFDSHPRNFEFVEPKICSVNIESLLEDKNCHTLSRGRYFELSSLRNFSEERYRIRADGLFL